MSDAKLIMALQQQKVESWAVINGETGAILELVEGRMPAINRARNRYATTQEPVRAVRLILQPIGMKE